MTKKNRTVINITANIISFLVVVGINFFLTPYIVNNVGSEAYGFVGLANNIISYAELITLAFNSLAIRFITLSICEGNIKRANEYFNSIIMTNIFISGILLIFSIYIIKNINNIVEIPLNILKDVKLLWIFLFLNFFVNLLGSTYNVSTFATNRIDLNSLRIIQSNILKVFILVAFFCLFEPHVWYIGLSAFICSIFLFATNIKYKYELLPFLKISIKYFEISKVKELFFSGIWSVVTKLGQLLSDGLDLLIANLFIDSSAMGSLALAKTVPMAIVSLLSNINNVFSPNITIYYANKDKTSLVKEINRSMRISGVFTSICISILIILGYNFYRLWVPNENAYLIQILSILTIFGMVFSGNAGALFNIFTVVNKLKLNSFVILINGLINSFLVFIIIKNSNLGIFAVAAVSSITSLIKNLTYTPIYAAKCLDLKWSTFYPSIIRYIICTVLNICICFICCYYLNKSNWLGLLVNVFLCLIIGFVIGYVIMLNIDEKVYFKNKIIKVLKK